MKTLHLTLLAFVLLLLAAGCDSSVSGLGDDDPDVRMVLRAQTAAPASAGKTSSRLHLDEAKVLVKTVKFNRVEDDEEEEFKSESFVVVLDPNGTANTVAVGSVPPGTYRRITFTIHTPEDNEPVPDPEFRDGPGGQQRFSVIVKGTIDGEPFVLKLRESTRQRIELVPPLVVSPGDQEVTATLVADVESWFFKDGRLLDPRAANDADDIADNVKDAFRAQGNENAYTSDDNGDDDNGDDDNGDDDNGDDDNGDDDNGDDDNGDDDNGDDDNGDDDNGDDDTGEDDEFEITGAIESLDAGGLTVQGMFFLVTDATGIFDDDDQPILYTDLAVGMIVEVEGYAVANGSMVAKKIDVEDDDDDTGEDDEFEITGAIESLDAGGLTVQGMSFLVTDATGIFDDDDQPILYTDLAVGMIVEVEGYVAVDGSMVAKKIEVEDDGDDDDGGNDDNDDD